MRMLGSKWLNQRSLHCLPILPETRRAISDHLVIPIFLQRIIVSSSSVVHGPFTSPGFNTFCHLCKHWTSVRLRKARLISFTPSISRFYPLITQKLSSHTLPISWSCAIPLSIQYPSPNRISYRLSAPPPSTARLLDETISL